VTLHTLNHAGWTKESSARALVGSKANDFSFGNSDIKRDGFVCEGNGDFIGPCGRKMLLDKRTH
jgi:hypothetical protein